MIKRIFFVVYVIPVTIFWALLGSFLMLCMLPIGLCVFLSKGLRSVVKLANEFISNWLRVIDFITFNFTLDED